ncbi:hypothetical protein K1T71_011350 [Dendrolimus kikuchii]|uniref:Uncharacterized protein n=1 Tax=Dendrolimus kikuchii TaxID=765133 RepID=A0ACC1CNK6_9NEOP|nr:hypothetical protein K1T71_011350 [Dendrolimus kikuchii]
MVNTNHINDSIHCYIGDLTSRIVAKSALTTDRFHLGKLILQCLEDDKDFINQIDGATSQTETNGSLLLRSVQCAIAFKNLGLKHGDVMVLASSNHLDQAVPFYAALYLGVIICPVDKFLGVNELYDTYKNTRPKIIFCESEKVKDNQNAVKELGIGSKIISFGESEDIENFNDFLKIDTKDTTYIDDFRATDFDPEDTIAVLIPTSGTTGTPKASAVTHKNLLIASPYFWSKYTTFPSPFKHFLLVSPLQWLTALVCYIFGPILKFTRLQSSLLMTQEQAYHIINKYRPDYTVMSPTMLATLVKSHERCDFTCFKHIEIGGSAVSKDLAEDIKKISPNTDVVVAYGMSEVCTLVFRDGCPPAGSCGKRIGAFLYKLVDIDTNDEIIDPNIPGELWMKGAGVFKGYYNNPDATKDAFSEDGWFKTGDMFYRDDNWNFYFVDRIKLLLKYRNHQISPVELENVIRQHAGVLDVAVIGLPDYECGDLPVACVVPRPGHTVNAQEIKDLVKESLTDSKQLRGGVVFLNELPTTASTKINRRKLKEIIADMKLE